MNDKETPDHLGGGQGFLHQWVAKIISQHMPMATLRMLKLQTFDNNRQRGVTNDNMYLTVWQVWSLILVTTG